MLTLKNSAVQAGLLLAAVFGLPSVMIVVTGGAHFLPVLLLPCAAYTSVRWQCRLAATIMAARTAWATNAHLD